MFHTSGFGRNLFAVIGSVLIATTFMAAATGPAIVNWVA